MTSIIHYKVASLNCGISNNVPLGEEGSFWRQFYEEDGHKPVFTIQMLDPFQNMYGIENYMTEEALPMVVRCQQEIMLVDKAWTTGKILPTENVSATHAFAAQMFCTAAVRNQMIQLHASLIEYAGRGILFLGPSGIGKTTQAQRWEMYQGASVINGDIVYVQETPNGFLGWGTPWHGSSVFCRNASVPVAMAVLLKKAPNNHLKELTGFEKVKEISGSVFYPMWFDGGMELCTDTLNHFLTDIPVYLLENKADQGAVQLVLEELKKS